MGGSGVNLILEGIQQLPAASVDDLIDLLKPVEAAIVGVRYISISRLGVELSHLLDAVNLMIVSKVDQILIILFVHCQNQIELIQVTGFKQPCPGEQFNSFALSHLAALAIGFLADVPGGGSGRADIKIGLKVLFIYAMLKETLGCCTRADL